MPRQLQFALLLCLLAWSASAASHAIITASKPRHGAILKHAPQTATLHFNSKIERSVTQIVLQTVAGEETVLAAIPGKDITSMTVKLPGLSPGVFRVVYRVLSADGHVTEGYVQFTLLKAESAQ